MTHMMYEDPDRRAPVPVTADVQRELREALVETVARALADASSPHDPRDWGDYVRDAAAAIAAAIAALPPSPAEEALSDLAEDMEIHAEEAGRGEGNVNAGDLERYVARLRAALASPAPAPQGEVQRAIPDALVPDVRALIERAEKRAVARALRDAAATAPLVRFDNGYPVRAVPVSDLLSFAAAAEGAGR